MARFDRYLLSQLLTLFGFFSLVLVFIYWIRAAVELFDELISDGQTAKVVLELTMLTLPGVVQIVLPLAAVVASIYVMNRMTSDSELVVMQGTGFSPVRLIRPAVIFGVIVTVLTMVASHFLVPTAALITNQRQAEISQNLAARMLVEGRFQSPTSGLTIYIRDISRSGELLDLFLSDTRDDLETMTYTASRAYLVKTDNGPQLVMIDGMAQALNTRTQRLSLTRFADFTYDLGDLVDFTPRLTRSSGEVTSLELLMATPELQTETGKSAGELIMEANRRNARALLGFVGAAIGAASLLVGGFSRFGVWKQVMLAIALIIVVKLAESTAENMMRTMPEAWMIPYLPIFVGIVITMVLLTIASYPARFRFPKGRIAA